MKNKTKNILNSLLLVFLLFGMIFPVSAFNPLPNSEKPFSLNYAINHLGTFTTVNGATCNTNPSKAGQPSSSLTLLCPTTDGTLTNKGCSIDLWDGYYKSYVNQYHINAGTNFVVNGGQTYEIYTCSDTTVTCGAETFGSCGSNGCAPGEVSVTRTCNPSGGSWEKTCVARSTCNPSCSENWRCGDWSTCTSSNTQTKKCDDLNVCGTTINKPKEVQSCTNSGGNGGNIITKSKTLTILQLKSLLASTDAQQAQDLPKSFCNVKEECNSADAQCITIGKASSTQSIADVFIPGSIENTIVNVFKAVFKLTTVEAQINKYNLNDAQGICLSDFSSITCVDADCTDTVNIKLHPGIDPNNAQGSTTEDLFKSSCTQNEQCETDSICKTLDWYTTNNYLTKDDAQQKINDARTKLSGTALGTGAGAIGGGLGGAALLGICTGATLGTAGAAAPLCFGAIGIGAIAGGVTGSQLGGFIADIVNGIGKQDTSAIGYCTLKTALPDTSSFFNKTIFDLGTFHVTGLYLIFGIIGLLVFLSLMPRRN